MPANFLGINMRSGTPIMQSIKGLTATTFGTSPGSAEAYTTGDIPLNRVIQFGSATTFLVLLGTTVRRTTDSGNTWATVLSFTSATTEKTGLHVVYQGGIATVCFISVASTTTTYNGYSSTDGINWTTEGPFTNIAVTNSLSGETVFRNSLYALNAIGGVFSNSYALVYSPGAGISFIILPAVTSGGTGAGSTLCVFNDSLCLLMVRTQLGAAIGALMYQLSSGNWVLTTATVIGVGGIQVANRWCMFVDGSFLYVFAPSSTTAWECLQCDTSFTYTNISSTVLPYSLLNATTVSTTGRLIPFVDGSTDPGSNPTKYLISEQDGASATAGYLLRWVDGSTTMVEEDIGGSVATAYSTSQSVGGQNYWTNGENSINLTARSGVMSGIRFSFQLFNTTGAATVVRVRAFFGNSTSEYPTTACTLTNPSSGSMSGNTITGLTVDNGVTTFQVTWNSAADGIAVTTRYRLIMEVFI